MAKTLCIPFLLLGLLWGACPSSLWAQAAADSTAADSTAADSTQSLSGLAAMAALSQGDTMRVAAADTAEAPPFRWLESYKPTLNGSLRSGLSEVLVSGSISASGTMLDGLSTSSKFSRSHTEFRQVDKQRDQSSLDTSVNGSVGPWGQLSLLVNRNTSDQIEVTRRGTGETTITTENTTETATASLTGSRKLDSGWSGAWGLRGEVRSTNVSNSNRDLINDRSLAGLSASGRLRYDTGSLLVAAKLGGGSSGGADEAITISDGSVQEGGNSTVQDTVGAVVSLKENRYFTFNLNAERATFDQKRLDLTRNQFGQISNENQVASEREESVADLLRVTAESNPLPPLRLESKFSFNTKETQYQLNPQGLVQNQSTDFSSDLYFTYAESGSLQITLKVAESWTDLKRLGETEFRGRQFRKNKEVLLRLQQQLLARTSLDMTATQKLTQNVLRDRPENDDDLLVNRFNATLTNESVDRLKIIVGGTLDLKRRVALGATNVSNNNDESLYEVRGGFDWALSKLLNIKQNYRMSIVITDHHTKRDNDSFVKQGRVDTTVTANLGGSGNLSLLHTFDLRQNGARDPFVEGSPVYRTSLRSGDHSLNVRVSAKLWGVEVDASTLRRFENDEIGDVTTYVERGDLRAGLKATRRFWNNRGTLNLDVQRILAYGPERLLNEESRDYYEANTSLSLTF